MKLHEQGGQFTRIMAFIVWQVAPMYGITNRDIHTIQLESQKVAYYRFVALGRYGKRTFNFGKSRDRFVNASVNAAYDYPTPITLLVHTIFVEKLASLIKTKLRSQSNRCTV